MKKYVNNTNDLLGKKITGVFINDGELIVATEGNFAVFVAVSGDWCYISDNLGTVDLENVANWHDASDFIAAGLITQEEVDTIKAKREEQLRLEKEDRERAQVQKELVEFERLKAKYGAN